MTELFARPRIWTDKPDATETCLSGSVVEHPSVDWEVVGLLQRWVISKTSEMVLAVLLLGTQHQKKNNKNWSVWPRGYKTFFFHAQVC